MGWFREKASIRRLRITDPVGRSTGLILCYIYRRRIGPDIPPRCELIVIAYENSIPIICRLSLRVSRPPLYIRGLVIMRGSHAVLDCYVSPQRSYLSRKNPCAVKREPYDSSITGGGQFLACRSIQHRITQLQQNCARRVALLTM